MTSASSSQPPRGRIAGIDFGTVRIGVAITDPEAKFASPLENYTRRGTAKMPSISACLPAAKKSYASW